MPISALIVRVMEAEQLVGELRERFDATAVMGMPAHITILVPFMSPDKITPGVLCSVTEAFAPVRCFEFTLNEVRRWPETTYLAPYPAAPFVEMTRAIWRRFPEYPPYNNKHVEIIPHLTVADGTAEGAEVAESELRSMLARSGTVRERVREIELLENTGGGWKIMHTFALPCSD